MSQLSNGDFRLHKQLAADCFEVVDLPLCRVLMINDSQYPWLLLVPRVPDITEIIDLNASQEAQLWKESRAVSNTLQVLFCPDKLNIAAIGNMVPQLHIHHVARFISDAAWPKPVWGVHAVIPYSDGAAEQRINMIQKQLKDILC